jgi:hypothetical protein
MFRTLLGGKVAMNKKGHFDFATFMIAVFVGIIAYLATESKALKNFLSKIKSKNEKHLRFWK